jgi:L-fuconolactonase
VYMEVDVDPRQHVAEADSLVALCKGGSSPTAAAVIGGEPASPEFASYVKRYRDNPYIRGVRQVLHSPKMKAGYCLRPEFIHGIRLLGEAGLSFDLCMRPGELGDGLKLTELCSETRFIVDHCGNADPKAFRKGNRLGEASHDVEAWKRDIGRLAGRKNTICKISGIVASAPDNWSPDDLAPIINHCLDAFGPDRVVFGGDWPVCLLHASYRQWVEALRSIISSRPAADRRKLWSENAMGFYNLRAS